MHRANRRQLDEAGTSEQTARSRGPVYLRGPDRVLEPGRGDTLASR